MVRPDLPSSPSRSTFVSMSRAIFRNLKLTSREVKVGRLGDGIPRAVEASFRYQCGGEAVSGLVESWRALQVSGEVLATELARIVCLGTESGVQGGTVSPHGKHSEGLIQHALDGELRVNDGVRNDVAHSTRASVDPAPY